VWMSALRNCFVMICLRVCGLLTKGCAVPLLGTVLVCNVGPAMFKPGHAHASVAVLVTYTLSWCRVDSSVSLQISVSSQAFLTTIYDTFSRWHVHSRRTITSTCMGRRCLLMSI
jgi:hypothetical protein